jgi:formamidopyrimidine-DNA glycosylase
VGERVEAVGKNLLLRFEGGLVLRSHLRMNGRWRVGRRGEARAGKPWLVLRGAEHEAILWNGSVLELVGSARHAHTAYWCPGCQR